LCGLKPRALWRLEEFRAHAGAFDSLAAFMGPVPFEIGAGEGQAERVWGHLVTPNYFRTLGVQPLAGRLFGVADERPGAASVAVVSARFWRAHFDAAPSAVGQPSASMDSGYPDWRAPEDFLGASPMLSAADLDSHHRPAQRGPGNRPPPRPPNHGLRSDRTPAARQRPGRAEASLEPLARRLEVSTTIPARTARSAA